MREFLRQKYLVAALLVAILTLSPSVASAQPAPPHLFIGSATIDGNPAADGTVVAALVDGQQVVAEPVSGGSYTIIVEPKTGSFFGKTVTFMIGGIPAKQTALWVEGLATELNLTATPTQPTPVPPPPPAATATPVLVVGEKGDAGPSGPQGSQGVQGPSGPPGVGGPPGSAGAAGPAGVAGPTGSQGLTGPGGDSGSKGSSLFGILALVFAFLAVLGTFGGVLWRRLVE